MPVQSPIKTKAKKSKALTTSSISKAIENISSVGELKKEKIVNIRQIGKSPTIKVRYESRPGKFEYETLYIDNAAEFFKNNYNHSKATAEVKKLRTFNQEAYFATYIFPDGDDLIAERVVAIKHTKSSLTRLESLAEDADIKNARLIVNRGQKGRLASYELIPIKNMNRQTGDKFIFIPERGYYPINKEDTKKAWEELPFKKSYKGDLAALFISNEYMDYMKYGPIVINEELLPPSFENKTEFQKIEVNSSDKGWFFLDPQYGTGKSSVSMAQMISAFKKEKKNFIKSGDQWFKIPQFIKEFDWEVDDQTGLLKVNTLGLLRLNAAAGDTIPLQAVNQRLKKSKHV